MTLEEIRRRKAFAFQLRGVYTEKVHDTLRELKALYEWSGKSVINGLVYSLFLRNKADALELQLASCEQSLTIATGEYEAWSEAEQASMRHADALLALTRGPRAKSRTGEC